MALDNHPSFKVLLIIGLPILNPVVHSIALWPIKNKEPILSHCQAFALNSFQWLQFHVEHLHLVVIIFSTMLQFQQTAISLVRAIPTWLANLGLFHVDLARNTLTDALQPLSPMLHYCFMAINAMHGTLERLLVMVTVPPPLAPALQAT